MPLDRDPKCVLLVGAGRFAAYYINALAEISRPNRSGPEFVGKLIVTKTDLQQARRLADEIHQRHPVSFGTVIGAQVRAVDGLTALLAEHAPHLTCITARDRRQGDAIHAAYTSAALAHGAVLCEKPFNSVQGDGTSLAALVGIQESSWAGRFGLELPMAVVGREMWRHPVLGPLLERARRIDFLWERPLDGPTGLLEDLALHPWSLLMGGGRRMWVRRVDEGQRTASIQLEWLPINRRRPVRCRIRLRSSGRFRGMALDDQCLSFGYHEGRMVVFQLTSDLDSAAANPGTHMGTSVMTVENPLKQQILSLQAGRPVVGIETALASQRFLEALVAHSRGAALAFDAAG
jgi:hypothetical protein